MRARAQANTMPATACAVVRCAVDGLGVAEGARPVGAPLVRGGVTAARAARDGDQRGMPGLSDPLVARCTRAPIGLGRGVGPTALENWRAVRRSQKSSGPQGGRRGRLSETGCDAKSSSGVRSPTRLRRWSASSERWAGSARAGGRSLWCLGSLDCAPPVTRRCGGSAGSTASWVARVIRRRLLCGACATLGLVAGRGVSTFCRALRERNWLDEPHAAVHVILHVDLYERLAGSPLFLMRAVYVLDLPLEAALHSRTSFLLFLDLKILVDRLYAAVKP